MRGHNEINGKGGKSVNNSANSDANTAAKYMYNSQNQVVTTIVARKQSSEKLGEKHLGCSFEFNHGDPTFAPATIAPPIR